MMDLSYRDRQGYYNEQDPQQNIRHHHHQPQHQLQPQQPQLLPHYAQQLSHHQSLLQPHLSQHQLHHSQPAFVLDQSDQRRAREECSSSRLAGPPSMQQLISGHGTHNHQPQYSDHTHPLLAQLGLTCQSGYPPQTTTNTQSMVDTTPNNQPFLSPDSPSPPQPQDTRDEPMVSEAPLVEQPSAEPPMPEPLPEPPMEAEAMAESRSAVPVAITEVPPTDADSAEAATEAQPEAEDAPQALVVIPEEDTPSDAPSTSTTKAKEDPKKPEPTGPTTRSSKIWKPDLPLGLSLKYMQGGKKIAGVRSEKPLEKGATFGPYNGKLIAEPVGSLKDSAWELCLRGKVFVYVDGQNKTFNNWMAFVESANSEEEQNLEAFQSYGDIYFRTTKVVEPGSELKVFYSDEYANHVGFKKKLCDLVYNKDTKSFPCSSCYRTNASAKRMLRHMRINHDPDRIGAMRPVITWEPCTSTENAENEDPEMASSAKTVNERFICTICGKNFPTSRRLAAHESTHAGSANKTCTICGETHTSSRSLSKHMRTHKPKPFECQSCGSSFASQNHLTRHKKLSHTYNHSCRVCGIQFIKKRECNKHEKTHPEWTAFKPLRKKARKTRRTKKVQINEIEEEVPAEEEEPEPEEEIEEPNPNLPKDMLGKRINYYDKPRPYKCRFCPKRYLSRNKKLAHEAEAHTKECEFKCKHCPAVFATEFRYVEHSKRHIQNRPFQCQFCPNSFASENALKNHMGEHTGLKPVKCEVCGKGFRTRHIMNAHKRRMHKVRQMRFSCSYCNKPFADKGNLVKHERRHKGIRPYVCLTCGRGFATNYSLTQHSYTHTKEKKFGCPQCDKRFTLNEHLTNHIYKVHTVHQKEQPPSIHSLTIGQQNPMPPQPNQHPNQHPTLPSTTQHYQMPHPQ
nr:histone-lysine N-methyltransferase PRDM9-like [Lytechinus pictus]